MRFDTNTLPRLRNRCRPGTRLARYRRLREISLRHNSAMMDLVSTSTYAREREREVTILCDPRLRRELAAEKIRLATFADL